MWCDVIWWDAMGWDVIWWDVMWCNGMWSDGMWLDGMRCDVMWWTPTVAIALCSVPRFANPRCHVSHTRTFTPGREWVRDLAVSQKCTSKGIWRQGVVLKHRNSLQKSPYPVVVCPDLCSYTVLYYTILYYTILYYTILYYTILCCTIL